MIPYWNINYNSFPDPQEPKWSKIIWRILLTIVLICIPILGWLFIPVVWTEDV